MYLSYGNLAFNYFTKVDIITEMRNQKKRNEKSLVNQVLVSSCGSSSIPNPPGFREWPVTSLDHWLMVFTEQMSHHFHAQNLLQPYLAIARPLPLILDQRPSPGGSLPLSSSEHNNNLHKLRSSKSYFYSIKFYHFFGFTDTYRTILGGSTFHEK